MDLMIAAHERSRGATLLSNDGRHFRRVEGLLVANWVRRGVVRAESLYRLSHGILYRMLYETSYIVMQG